MRTVSQSIPVERLWRLYDYNPLTGQLWSKTKKKYMTGTFRGRQVDLNITKCTTNYGRAVFAWCTGAWPTNQVDHINRNPQDNHIWNLRDVTNRENAHNRKGFQGCRKTRAGNYQALIRDGKNQIILGTFPNKAEAQAAYQIALKDLS